MGMGKKNLAVLHVLRLSQVMWVLPRNACSHSRREVGSVCIPQTSLWPLAPGFANQRSPEPTYTWVSVRRRSTCMCGDAIVSCLRAVGHIKAPEDSHPSGTVGAKGDIRVSTVFIYLFFIHVYCSGLVASNTACSRRRLQLLTQATGLLEGLLSSRKVARL